MLVEAHAAIRDGATTGDALARAGQLEQLAYKEISVRPGWDRPVLAALPRDLRWVTRTNVAARRDFRAMHPSATADLATELPAWRIQPPPPLRTLRASYGEAARRSDVDWSVLAAIHLTETVFGRISGVSSAGAVGPMQFLPTTWDLYGEGGDIHDPHDAILAAGRGCLPRTVTPAIPPGRSGATTTPTSTCAASSGSLPCWSGGPGSCAGTASGRSTT